MLSAVAAGVTVPPVSNSSVRVSFPKLNGLATDDTTYMKSHEEGCMRSLQPFTVLQGLNSACLYKLVCSKHESELIEH